MGTFSIILMYWTYFLKIAYELRDTLFSTGFNLTEQIIYQTDIPTSRLLINLLTMMSLLYLRMHLWPFDVHSPLIHVSLSLPSIRMKCGSHLVKRNVPFFLCDPSLSLQSPSAHGRKLNPFIGGLFQGQDPGPRWSSFLSEEIKTKENKLNDIRKKTFNSVTK